ncbi:MAG TPA: hypothetical protein VF590_26250 [Isosphaeraceae bacterium]
MSFFVTLGLSTKSGPINAIALMFAYTVLIPNSWRSAAAVVLVLAAYPLATAAAVTWARPELLRFTRPEPVFTHIRLNSTGVDQADVERQGDRVVADVGRVVAARAMARDRGDARRVVQPAHPHDADRLRIEQDRAAGDARLPGVLAEDQVRNHFPDSPHRDTNPTRQRGRPRKISRGRVGLVCRDEVRKLFPACS